MFKHWSHHYLIILHHRTHNYYHSNRSSLIIQISFLKEWKGVCHYVSIICIRVFVSSWWSTLHHVKGHFVRQKISRGTCNDRQCKQQLSHIALTSILSKWFKIRFSITQTRNFNELNKSSVVDLQLAFPSGGTRLSISLIVYKRCSFHGLDSAKNASAHLCFFVCCF